jgi:hypothetical protein
MQLGMLEQHENFCWTGCSSGAGILRSVTTMDQIESEDMCSAACLKMVHHLIQYIIFLTNLLATASTTLITSTFLLAEQWPYHTFILTSEGWVMELLTGHPNRICKLGVHYEVFFELILELQRLGHTWSKFVSLEEQLAIFLYTSVTSLMVWHVGERFQRSNDMISQWAKHFNCYIIFAII